MKLLPLILFTAFISACGSNKKFPEKMPADFKVEYHLDGGMVNMNRTIVLQNGACSDKGREDGGLDYEYKFTITDVKEFETLYGDLKKLRVFAIQSKNKGQVMDRGGESIRFTIEGKEYMVDNSQSNFISMADEPAFNNAISLITSFTEKYRGNNILSSTSKKDSMLVDPNIDTTRVIFQPPAVEGAANENNLAGDEAILLEKNTGIPAKMPNDFKITYEMSGGFTGAYRTILLQYGTSNDEGKNAGEAGYKKSFINKSIKDFEKLYAELYKLNAFLLKYTSKGNTADRGGETVKFTINKKEFTVSNKDNNYIQASDKTAFKKSIALILAYVDAHQ